MVFRKSTFTSLTLILSIFSTTPAHALVEAAALFGYRRLSSQGDNGDRLYKLQSGVRLTLFQYQIISPELIYSYTGADFSGVKAHDHAFYLGIRATPSNPASIKTSFLAGYNYLLTRYSGSGSSEGLSDSQSALYLGVGFTSKISILSVRLDFIDSVHLNLKDSSFMVSLSAGVSL